MPGLGPPATIAMLLPLTALMNPAGAIIMLAGIYLRREVRRLDHLDPAQRAGESASVVTCLDGYAMARKGRAGPALGIAAIASFIAGTVGVLGPDARRAAARQARARLQRSRVLSRSCRSASPWWCCSPAVRMVKALLAMLLGLWIAGIAPTSSRASRAFTFGRMELLSGIDFVVVAIGIFAIGEVLANMESREEPQALPVPKGVRNLLPTMQDLRDCRFAFAQGSVIGFLVGVLRAPVRPSPRSSPTASRRRSPSGAINSAPA